MRPRRNQRANPQRVTNVRVLDQDADTESGKVIRMIGDLHRSGSHIRVMVTSVFNAAGGVAENDVNYSFRAVVASDEWSAFAAQFEEFRVRAMRFDCYNTNAAVSNPAAASTFRVNSLGSSEPAFVYTDVVDGDDSKILPNNGQRTSFFWMARTTDELAYQTTEAVTSNSVINHGGLRLSLPVNTSGGNVQTIAKFIVDFRGRK